jgi:hypothetical protein
MKTIATVVKIDENVFAWSEPRIRRVTCKTDPQSGTLGIELLSLTLATVPAIGDRFVVTIEREPDEEVVPIPIEKFPQKPKQ